MEAIKKYRIVILVIIVLILAFFVVRMFTGKSKNSNDVLTSTNNTTQVSNIIGQQFVNQLITLKSVTLDTSLFSDPRFRTLQDSSQPIPDQPYGRPNPFAPIGQDDYTGSSLSPINSSNYNFTFDHSSSTASSTRH